MAPKTTIDFLEAIKQRHGVSSDYAVSKLLGVTRQSVSHYRRGVNGFEDLVALRVAELLELDPLAVIAARNAERAKRMDVRKIWEGVARKAFGAAIGLILAGFLAPIGDGFSVLATAATAKPDYMLYAVSCRVKQGPVASPQRLAPALASAFATSLRPLSSATRSAFDPCGDV